MGARGGACLRTQAGRARGSGLSDRRSREEQRMSGNQKSSEWPLWEVFVRSRAGLDHKHCGSLHATDAKMAIQMARDVYTRRQEGTSIWVVRSDQIVASDPEQMHAYFDPMEDKVYRHPSFYELPESVNQM